MAAAGIDDNGIADINSRERHPVHPVQYNHPAYRRVFIDFFSIILNNRAINLPLAVCLRLATAMPAVSPASFSSCLKDHARVAGAVLRRPAAQQ